MADDGLILNFATDTSVSSTFQKFKGGSWRDRVVARKELRPRKPKRSAAPGERPAQTVSAKTHTIENDAENFPNPQPTKRRRDEAYPANVKVKRRTEGSSEPNKRSSSGTQREVVSSLFTANPEPSTLTQPAVESGLTESVDPSNAPLSSELETFTSLGLSTTIAAHLMSKMGLKQPTAIQKAAVIQMLKEEGDAFVQSETGSGKTLAYLLPIVQKIAYMAKPQTHTSATDALHRDSGLFAIVLAPTRELCKQISVVLERLLGCVNYIVAGTVTGGERKKSEKARLRKGLNILVATPGRLVDHLKNTKAFDVSLVRWLILDEGDRLMDMGFEQDISEIISSLNSRKLRSVRDGLPVNRSTVLCSATLKMNVQKLGEISLKDAALIKGHVSEGGSGTSPNEESQSTFSAPAQLKQSYLVVPAKLRLVTLTALLRHTFARKGSVMKAIVFVSCADSVEFHFNVLTRPSTDSGKDDDEDKINASDETAIDFSQPEIQPSPLLTTSAPLIIYKLHGSLPQPTRTSIVKAFREATVPSLLIATDVASRGLDLPNLDLVIEYDPAFSSDDHIHRIGRTARLGRDGRATIFLMPGKEENYVDILKSSYRNNKTAAATATSPENDSLITNNVTHTPLPDILRKGFTPAHGLVSQSSKVYEQKATDFQLDVERWVLESEENKEAARKAFQSHVRAYATHVAVERKYFDIKELHLGHLAKAFGLREAPGRMGRGDTRGMTGAAGKKRKMGRDGDGEVVGRNEEGSEEAARKMRKVVSRQKGIMGGAGGADEFNLA